GGRLLPGRPGGGGALRRRRLPGGGGLARRRAGPLPPRHRGRQPLAPGARGGGARARPRPGPLHPLRARALLQLPPRRRPYRAALGVREPAAARLTPVRPARAGRTAASCTSGRRGRPWYHGAHAATLALATSP